MRYHYVLTLQFSDARGTTLYTHDGDAYFHDGEDERARYDSIKARMVKELGVPGGTAATMFYRCVLANATEVIQAVAKAA